MTNDAMLQMERRLSDKMDLIRKDVSDVRVEFAGAATQVAVNTGEIARLRKESRLMNLVEIVVSGVLGYNIFSK